MTKSVALISEHASPLALLGGVDAGGQNVYVDRLARLLPEYGYSVDVYTRRDDPKLPAIAELAEDVRVVHVPAGPATTVRKEELLPYMRDFTEFVRRHCRGGRRSGLIHANFFMSALVAADVKRALGLPFVVTFHALGRVRRLHQGDADAFPAERLAIEDRVVREADRVIAECPQDEDDLVNLYAAERRRLVTIPCGFDPEEFRSVDKREARARLGLDATEPIVLQLGRMVPRKGVDNAIRGIGRLRREHGIAARLLIVGGESRRPDPAVTPEIGRLMQVANEEGAADLVTFIGARGRDELRYFYSAADVFVTTPWYEPFGITPVEAAACGTPVIGSAVGGIRTTVVDGRTGYLVPPRDPASLAERLARLLRDPLLLRSFGRNALHRARTLYTWRSVAAGVAAVYDETLESAGLPRAVGSAVGAPASEAIGRPVGGPLLGLPGMHVNLDAGMSDIP